MKAVVKAGILAAAASGASGTLARKAETIPIIGYIRIMAEGGRLMLTATNMEEQVSVPAEAEVAAEGGICVPGKQFVQTISTFDPDAMVSLEMDGAKLIARCGRARLKLPTLPIADFPNMVPGEAQQQFAIGLDMLVTTFATVGFAISDEETRYYLNGVLWNVEKDHLWFAATDGHRLAAMTIRLPNGAKALRDVIIPKGLVRRLVKRGGGKGDVQIALTSRVVQMVFPDGTEMISKLVNGSFPDWRRVVPQRSARILTTSIETLEAAAARVATVAGDKARGLRVEMEADKIRLSARSDFSGEMEEEVAAELTGEPIIVGLNANYLRAQLAVLSGETVKMHLHDPRAPILIEGDNDDARFVLMPMNA